MVYRRYPYLHRNYYYSEPKPPREKNTEQVNDNKDILEEKGSKNIKLAEDIPMPNEKENIRNPEASFTPGFKTSIIGQRNSKFSLSSILPENLNFEDILILGIIFILLYEGKKDDMLLVVLIYLLI